MATREPKGNYQALDRAEHDKTAVAKRVISADPFGGLITEGNFTTKVEVVDANTTYIGIAQIGTLPSVAQWQIKKITVSGTVTSIEWAESTDTFTNEWDERATYNYA